MDWRARLAEYLTHRLPSADSVAIVRASAMPAGASNETIALDVRVCCDGVESELALVLRPERPDGILAPYDVGRQYRVMRALTATAVPVPPVAWYEPDATILGAPFFLMARVSAQTPPLFWYGPGPRVDAAAEVLARIHAVDFHAVGLSSLIETAPSSPLENELVQWRRRAEHLRMERAPVLEQLERYLVAHEPADAAFALLHGDTNAGNYLFRGDEVVAVVDWELASIGDPRSDLGFYGALNTMFGGYQAEAPGSSVLSRAYEQATGRALTSLPYYEAWGLYRMLVVMGGWSGRGWGGFYGTEAIAHRLAELLGRDWAAS